ncbi:MAG: protocatechuate 3,4-dioxygenase [Verrucomicrobiota bacterium]
MLTRREILKGAVFSAGAFAVPGLFAEWVQTPSMTEGPYYPDKLPLDTDNDLLLINDSLTPAVGTITHLSGRILSKSGLPIRNALVEIWQADNSGVYLHSGDTDNRDRRDANFQSYGRFLTDSKGQYYFRTIKPVPYGASGIARTPHIHFRISRGGKRALTTQMLVNGHPDNADDILFRRIKDPKAKQTLLVDFNPMEGSKIGEVSAHFDIVLGHTVEELDDGSIRGLGGPI